jgi:DNA-binding GntR family transcriptional regulator
MNLNLVQTQTLQDHVYTYLYNKIVSGDIPPGQRIVEQKVAKETGISRSPVREAIRRLESENLVIVSPRGGVKVYRPTYTDFQHLYECRISLEPSAAYYAALRIDGTDLNILEELMNKMNVAVDQKNIESLRSLSSKFHLTILKASGNPYLVKVMKQLNSLLTFYRNAVLNIPQRLHEGAIEHEAILLAIKNNNSKEAEELMKLHIKKDYQFYLSEYDKTQKS